MHRTQTLSELSQDLAQRVESLTDRQRMALQLRGSGLSCKEAAAKMELGYDAFKDLCFRARTKLGATNTPEAVTLLQRAENNRLRLAIHRARETLLAQTCSGAATDSVLRILHSAVHA